MIVVVLFKNTVLFHAFKKMFKIRPAKHCKCLKKVMWKFYLKEFLMLQAFKFDDVIFI